MDLESPSDVSEASTKERQYKGRGIMSIKEWGNGGANYKV